MPVGPLGLQQDLHLARPIAGHERVSGGEILIGDRLVDDLPPGRRGTAMMFQSYALFPPLSVVDNVAFPLHMRGVPKAERRARALATLERLQKELGLTFVHLTRSQDEALALADLVVAASEGRIAQAGPAREVFNRPACGG